MTNFLAILWHSDDIVVGIASSQEHADQIISDLMDNLPSFCKIDDEEMAEVLEENPNFTYFITEPLTAEHLEIVNTDMCNQLEDILNY